MVFSDAHYERGKYTRIHRYSMEGPEEGPTTSLQWMCRVKILGLRFVLRIERSLYIYAGQD